jgi:hypothetical protein
LVPDVRVIEGQAGLGVRGIGARWGVELFDDVADESLARLDEVRAARRDDELSLLFRADPDPESVVLSPSQAAGRAAGDAGLFSTSVRVEPSGSDSGMPQVAGPFDVLSPVALGFVAAVVVAGFGVWCWGRRRGGAVG